MSKQNANFKRCFNAWIAYYKKNDGNYFYFGRLRHAYQSAKVNVYPRMPAYIR